MNYFIYNRRKTRDDFFSFENVHFRYNGQIPGGDRGRRRSRFQIRQRIQANGLKLKQQHLCESADQVHVNLSRDRKAKQIGFGYETLTRVGINCN